MKKIQQNLHDFLSDPDKNISSGGAFKAKDFFNLKRVIETPSEDFLIFDNAGGKRFDIMFDRILPNETGELQAYPVKDFIEHLLKEHRSWIYCYQLGGVQTILKNI